MVSTIQNTIFFTAIMILVVTGMMIKGVDKKVHREIEKVFQTSEYQVQPITIPASLSEDLPTRITGDNFFVISSGTSPLGYAFVDKAPSKTAEFDYLVLFNTELEVVHSKVLVYREEYGGEIGSRRWLRQFNGKTGKDRVCPETNIDAISGATISVRSMTRSMDRLLQSIGILQDKAIL